ncbi:MAG: pseudouridine synthase, partial [Gemmatimonadota bacterium]
QRGEFRNSGLGGARRRVTEQVRLQKFLARAGVASRRASEDLIRAGRVRVNGEVAALGSSVDPNSSAVTLDGRTVRAEPLRWIMLHKPPGVMCSRSDPEGRETIYQILPDQYASLFHVGRLDYMSEGLILLTNDGNVSNRLLHPSAQLARRYRVTLAAPVGPEVLQALLGGVELEDGPARATAARFVEGGRADQVVLELELREGRNRVIRRIMSALGLTVHSLCRTSFGPLQLGSLARGGHRLLTPPEIRQLEERVSRKPSPR